MENTAETPAAAGWHEDPNNSNNMRYWNGRSWGQSLPRRRDPRVEGDRRYRPDPSAVREVAAPAEKSLPSLATTAEPEAAVVESPEHPPVVESGDPQPMTRRQRRLMEQAAQLATEDDGELTHEQEPGEQSTESAPSPSAAIALEPLLLDALPAEPSTAEGEHPVSDGDSEDLRAVEVPGGLPALVLDPAETGTAHESEPAPLVSAEHPHEEDATAERAEESAGAIEDRDSAPQQASLDEDADWFGFAAKLSPGGEATEAPVSEAPVSEAPVSEAPGDSEQEAGDESGSEVSSNDPELAALLWVDDPAEEEGDAPQREPMPSSEHASAPEASSAHEPESASESTSTSAPASTCDQDLAAATGAGDAPTDADASPAAETAEKREDDVLEDWLAQLESGADVVLDPSGHSGERAPATEEHRAPEIEGGQPEDDGMATPPEGDPQDEDEPLAAQELAESEASVAELPAEGAPADEADGGSPAEEAAAPDPDGSIDGPAGPAADDEDVVGEEEVPQIRGGLFASRAAKEAKSDETGLVERLNFLRTRILALEAEEAKVSSRIDEERRTLARLEGMVEAAHEEHDLLDQLASTRRRELEDDRADEDVEHLRAFLDAPVPRPEPRPELLSAASEAPAAAPDPEPVQAEDDALPALQIPVPELVEPEEAELPPLQFTAPEPDLLEEAELPPLDSSALLPAGGADEDELELPPLQYA